MLSKQQISKMHNEISFNQYLDQNFSNNTIEMIKQHTTTVYPDLYTSKNFQKISKEILDEYESQKQPTDSLLQTMQDIVNQNVETYQTDFRDHDKTIIKEKPIGTYIWATRSAGTDLLDIKDFNFAHSQLKSNILSKEIDYYTQVENRFAFILRETNKDFYLIDKNTITPITRENVIKLKEDIYKHLRDKVQVQDTLTNPIQSTLSENYELYSIIQEQFHIKNQPISQIMQSTEADILMAKLDKELNKEIIKISNQLVESCNDTVKSTIQDFISKNQTPTQTHQLKAG